MAIYHFTAKIVSRSRGQSAVAKAAYNAHDRLTNDKTGERHDYRHKGAVMFSGIFAPKNAPDWVQDRQTLWSEVEKAEKRINSQVAREIEIALPHELTDKQREYLVKDFVRENFVRHGMVADVAIHSPSKEGDERNHHAHILLSLREIGPDGFGAKLRDFNSKAQLEQWREKWEHLANRHLERHGHAARIDRRSLEAQGLDREPTIHKGPVATQFEREGERSERGQANRDIEARNRQRQRLRAEEKAVGRILARETGKATHAAEKTIGKGAHTAKRLTGGFLKAVDSALDLLVGAPPPREYTPAQLVSDPAARRASRAQLAAEIERNEVLDRWDEQLKESGNDYSRLSATDVQYLTGADLENIRAYNQDAVKQILREREKQREMEASQIGRERERGW
jgi:hypothetical protein